MLSRLLFLCSLSGLLALLTACGSEWNNPYPTTERTANTLYSAFTDRPKHLDPVQSYAEDEFNLLGQIYEPPLQYHYLKRPYALEPLTVKHLPVAQYLDAREKPLPADVPPERIAYTDYVFELKPGIRFQPHPAFARTTGGDYRYHALSTAELDKVDELRDFPEQDTRELTAEDYVYAIKRLAQPGLHSPILGLMSEYIIGLDEYAKTLAKVAKETKATGQTPAWLDLRKYPLAGVEVLDRYRYRIRIKGKYPQFLYWQALFFFAPMPWEAERFHSQPGMAEKNLVLDWYPVGTGAFMMTENNPNSRMVLERNPNYHGEAYPCEGEAGDLEAGLLADCGKPLPFIDKVVLTREKEQIPYWNKFQQGYYDASGISSDSFDQAVQVGGGGDVTLSEKMQAQGIRLITSVDISDMYLGFNMLDTLVGSANDNPEQARKLRHAISIAIDQEEFNSIFRNGRAIAAQGPIPPGIFGYRPEPEGINSYMYRTVDGKPVRRDVAEARRLLAEAGYPNGRNAKTGEPLVVNLDTTGTGVGSKAHMDWLGKQFRKIDVQLVVRSTDWNRLQEKTRKGTAQLFYFGWNADYPDPENFLGLFHGPQSRAKGGGENSVNYNNPVYDWLFVQMRAMESSPERQRLIDEMVDILRRDAPWVWGFHPKDYVLAHAWIHNRKPTKVSHNTLKYQRLDPELRAQKRAEWNEPVVWPAILLGVLCIAAAAPAFIAWRRRENRRLQQSW